MACLPRARLATIVLAAACCDGLLADSLDRGERGCAGGATEPISLLRTTPSRSPSGLLNPDPPAPGAVHSTAAGGSVAACAELGLLAGGNDEDAALFRSYRDFGGSALVNMFWLGVDDGQARFVEAFVGALGRDDQHAGLRVGRHNGWTLSAFYTETPHVFSNRYRSLWSGVGTAELSLAHPALVAGGQATPQASQDAIRGALAETSFSTLQIVRKKGGFSWNATLSEAWKTWVSYSAERRRGARPFGAVFGGGDGGGNVELPESIDDITHEFDAGVSYVAPLSSLNLAVSASMFSNRIDTLSFANPLTVLPDAIAGIQASAFTQGRHDLAPDNHAYSAKADVARVWPDWHNARLTASLALTSMRQNDALIAPTPLSLSGATLGGSAAENQWNTTAALTRPSAAARIDTRLLALSLALSPARGLSLTGRLRHHGSDNSTDYLACNPLTGQFGRLLNDGSGAALVDVPAWLAARCDPVAVRALGIAPDAGDITLRNVPHQTTQRIFALAADWQLGGASTLRAALEREEHRRRHRERARTWEDKLEFGYTNRGVESATLRASVELGERRGSPYSSDPYRPFVSAGLGPLPTAGEVSSWIRNVEGFRKFDLADRSRGALALRANVALSERIDAAASYTGRRIRYPRSDFGRNGREDQDAVNVELNVQAASGLSLYGHVAVERGRMAQSGIQPVACVIGAAGVSAADFEQRCGAAGGPLFPLDRFWAARSRDWNEVAGAGGRVEWPWGVLDVDVVHSRARTAIRYASGPGITLTPEQQALAGSGWPGLRFNQSVLTASLRVPLTRSVSARLWLQLERGRVDDWHHAGLLANPVPAADAVYLDGGAERYRASLVGVLLRFEL